MKECCPKEHDNSNTIDAESIVVDDIIVNTGGFISLPDGSNTEPPLRFNTSPSSGLYHTGNTIVLDIQAVPVSSISLDTNSITNIIPIQGPTGTAGNPAFSFQADVDTGIYRENTNQLALTTGGVNRLSLSATGMEYSVNSYAPTGNTGAPCYSFKNDITSGIYYDTSEQLVGISSRSKKAFGVNATGTNFYTNNVLTGSVLSNGFSSSVQERIIIKRPAGPLPSIINNTTTTYTSYDTPQINIGFSVPASGVFTIPKTGLYQIGANTGWGSNSAGYRQTQIVGSNLNGIRFAITRVEPSSVDATYYDQSTLYEAVAGNTFRIDVLQTSGGSLICDMYVSCFRIC